MNRSTDTFLQSLIAVLLGLFCAVALAVPKAADQEDDEVTFSEAGAPPKRTSKPYRAPAAGVATPGPSVRPARAATHPERMATRPARTHARSFRAHSPARAYAKSSRAHPPVRTFAKTSRFQQSKPQAKRSAATGKQGFSRHTGNASRTLVKRAGHTPRARPAQRLEHRRMKTAVRPISAGRHSVRASGRPAVRHGKKVDRRRLVSRKNRR